MAPARASASPRARLRAWWTARLPLTDSWQLTQHNIYILPTRAGLAFAATMLLMLLASINYQLNLGFVLTFLLSGSGLVSMHLTHSTLRGLTLHLRPPPAVFAGEASRLDIVISNPGAQRHGLACHLQQRQARAQSFAWCDVAAGGSETVRLSVVPARRGWSAVPTLELTTGFPFGLFRAWTVWRPVARVLAWPQPEQPTPPLPPTGAMTGEDAAVQQTQGSELDGLRPWRHGDSMRQLAWKKFARTGELVSRETSSTGSRQLWLDWSATAGRDTEQRLSRLAAWVLQADREGLRYGLRLPGREWPPGQGDAHRHALLDGLAEWT
ncbi:MAG: DUF58 domain-containing protein [Rubrivivax sp.]|nr:DUF58 domain-containing protein [Rubrivivax sp.]